MFEVHALRQLPSPGLPASALEQNSTPVVPHCASDVQFVMPDGTHPALSGVPVPVQLPAAQRGVVVLSMHNPLAHWLSSVQRQY